MGSGSVAIGVLVPRLGADAAPPEARPLGRAALRLESEGIEIVFGWEARGGVLVGVRAEPGRWVTADRPIRAAYDRFPSQGQSAHHERLLAALPGVPVANAPWIVALCRDKLAAQLHLERAGIEMPEVEADPARFAERLARWGSAFLKPRHGAFGRGVQRVVAGEPIPRAVDGPMRADALLLQRAVPPPEGYAGRCVRALVQRTPAGWVLDPPVLRESRTDPVVNAARGAEVHEIERFGDELGARVRRAALQVASAFDAEPLAIELGIDLVVDPDGAVWPIEINGTPRGHLEVLARADPGRWAERHVESCCRPLRCLAHGVPGPDTSLTSR